MPKNIDRDEFMRLMTCIQEARATMERLLPLALEPLRPGVPPEPVMHTAEEWAAYDAARRRRNECEDDLRVLLGGVPSK